MAERKSKWLSGARINPEPIRGGVGAADLIHQAFLAYNAGRLQKASRLYVEKMPADHPVVGMSLTGALTPAGLGRSVFIPLRSPRRPLPAGCRPRSPGGWAG